MKERIATRELRRTEFVRLAIETTEVIKNLFPNAASKRFYNSREYTTADNYLISLAFDGNTQEALLSVDHKDPGLEESLQYIIKGRIVKKEGYRIPHLSKSQDPVYYTDDEETIDNLMENHPHYDLKSSLTIGLEELKILSEIVKDPIGNQRLVHELSHLPKS